MSSRLERLFVLLSTASTSSTRSLAAKQLGGLVKSHPGELPTLLSHLHPLLHSSQWDTRLAAAEALEAILEEMPKWDPAIKKEDKEEKCSSPTSSTPEVRDHPLRFHSFNLERLLKETDGLTASQGQEFTVDVDSKNDFDRQRKALNKTLGLDVAARLGVQTNNIFSKEDLLAGATNGQDSMSVREKNRLKRSMSKNQSIQSAAIKKHKLAPKLYKGERREDDIRWPLEDFCGFLLEDLFEKNWEIRHGSATALREIVRLQGEGAGKIAGMGEIELKESHEVWLEDVSLRLISVIARDQFGDFVSDQVVAPVRESAAQALGAVLRLMSPENVKCVVCILLQLLKQNSWQCRHGGMLGIKYLLAVRSDLTIVLLHDLYPAILVGLQDDADDVVGVSASSLLSVVHCIVDNAKVDINELTGRLWDTLKELDDLTSSTHSIMQLLSEILKQQRCPSSLSSHLSSTSLEITTVIDRVPRLFPFLSHSSSLVRKAALSTLDTLTCSMKLAQLFLPHLVKPLTTHLFQRALLEHQEDSLDLIERIWNNSCDFTPLGPLLMSTCPLYGTWVSLITQPPSWPLPPHMLIKADGTEDDKHQFLGGPAAQHVTDAKEKDRLVVRARYLGAKLLGKLAGFIIQPVPGMDYSKDALPPMEMFATKILLPNLSTQSAYRRAAMGLIISEWCEQHVVTGVSDSLKLTLTRYLTEPVNYDETVQAFGSLQTDTGDFISTLKHYKLQLPPGIIGEAGNNLLSFEQIRSFLTKTDFKAVVSTNARLKQKVVQSILERLDEGLIPCMNQMLIEQAQLSTMTVACIAGAVILLQALPEKLNPVIKPLMESIKKEPNRLLQSLSARRLARVLEICISRGNPAPAEKVLKNLVAFASADPSATPTFTAWPMAKINSSILTLALREVQSSKKVSKVRKSKPPVAAVRSDPTNVSESLTINANGTVEACITTVEDEERLEIQTRGAKIGLEAIIRHFHSEVFEKLAKVYELTLGAILAVGTEAEKPPPELIFCLRAFEIIVPVLVSSLHERISTSIPGLVALLRSDFSCLRHMAARCLAQISRILPVAVMTSVINYVIPLFESQYVTHRQGAIECLSCIVEQVETNVIPFIVLLIVPVLGRMSDLDEDVRLLSTNIFATLIKLVPLEGSVRDPEGISEELLEKKEQERKFLDQLTNVKNLDDYRLEVRVDVELRKYQRDGVNWLGFLNRYKLHGILCDDMGLGKTLQTICMVANHHLLTQETRPSLVICPPTLCRHWSTEIVRFIGTSVLQPLVYLGPTAARADIRKLFPTSNLIISSYDVVRNDADFFSEIFWNYLVLDEGQIIKNGKTKTTLAIKRLRSNYRLILSGTPIQNSVLELWSLFDFLMPGFLGTEQQFGAKYSRPIIASRDPKCSAREQEAGALAMEALHRQVLPFVLRRMKDDVLTDLPPKITQDFYCDLSPIQEKLYEDFARKQSKLSGDAATGAPESKTHVFQALQYLRKVCNHPKLVLDEKHQEYNHVVEILRQTSSSLDDISHSAKLPALRDLFLQCGIGIAPAEIGTDIVVQHRALVFFQLKAMMDIVENDLLKQRMPSVTYLRLDGSVPAGSRQTIVDKFNQDVSIDVLLLSTSVGGLGLNLTGADTVIFVEHDWNPMKDLQAMDRAHRIGQKKVVNVYRLITRHTIEEKIMGLQKFKIKTANTVISSDNASLQSMATDQLFDLFSLEAKSNEDNEGGASGGKKTSIRTLLEEMPELWDVEQYDREYDIQSYLNKNANKSN